MADVPPQAQLFKMAGGFGVSQLVHVAAQLGLADGLADGPKTADELARSTSTHAPSLYRVMRVLASLGLFTEDEERRFSLTPLSEALRTGAPGSVRVPIQVLTSEYMMRAWGNLLYSVQTGRPGFEKEYGMPFFDWLADHPEEAAMFNETMVGFHGAEPAAVAAAYDFSGFGTIVDVGGGTGNLLTTILARHAGPRGILFDMPHVVRDAPARIQARGLADRISIEAGSFFDGVPAGGDVYLLSHVIHDWNESMSLTILGNCRRAMKPASRLLILDLVIPPGNGPHAGKGRDIGMLVLAGGQERTEPEFRALLDKAGFRLTRIVPTDAVSVVEAVPA